MLKQKNNYKVSVDNFMPSKLIKTKKKISKVLFRIIMVSFVFLIIALSCIFAYFYVKINSQYGNLQFDKEKLITATSYVQITDSNDKKIGNVSMNGRLTIEFNQIPANVINAFIAIEDKNFYKHNGLDYKRIIKSLLTNIKNGYSKEGASTISQQLIKNTHLNNDKTIERKLKEIFLTKKLEKTFTKDEILEIYLNIIYFGNSCFGIEEASNFYFGKSAKDLSIAQSATLASIIKSPKFYNPISNYDKCVQRRNLVISQMLKCGFISNEEAKNAISEKLEVGQNFTQSSFEKLVIDEVCKLLKMSEKELVRSNLKINTTLNHNLQKIINEIDLSFLEINNVMPDYAILIEKNSDSSIQAIRSSNIDILNMKRQPASCLKPFVVYAPNLEDGKINLLTKINDSPINFSGFAPTNSDKKYRGEISTTEALSVSSNICATKLLNYYGIDKAKKYAQKFGFTFDKNDNHLALALGSLYYGCDLFTLTNAYATLARNGVYIAPKIVESINTEFHQLYHHKNEERIATTPETSYQLTLALQECSANGTGKKLHNFSEYVACKTGTCGLKNSSLNTDAYNISYSKDYTVCVWIGANEKVLLPQNLTGGNHPSIIANEIWCKLNPQTSFIVPQNIIEKNIDKITYNQNGQIKLADEKTPDRYIIKAKFAMKFQPTEYSSIFSSPPPINLNAKRIGNKVTLSFETKKYYDYELVKCLGNEISILKNIKNKSEQHTYIDTISKENTNIVYYVILTTPNNKVISNKVKILV